MPSTPTKGTPAPAEPATPKQIIDAVVARTPSSLKPAAQTVAPAALALVNFIIAAVPYAMQAYDMGCAAYKYIEPYEGAQTALIGFVYCFFGGSFMTLIAAWEAFQMCGYNETKRCLGVLYSSYLVAKEASDKDDEVDADGDGIADVKQIDAAALVQRKVLLVMKSVDPEVVSEAWAGVWGGFMGVVAVLRVKFAQAITLGAAIADTATKMAETTIKPSLIDATPPEYQKWVGPFLTYFIKFVAVSVAWFIQRVISCIHTSTRGAEMLMTGAVQFAKAKGVDLPDFLDPGTPIFQAVCTGVAAIGAFWQIYNGFAIPWLLSLPLLPITFLETLLYQFTAYDA